MGISKITRILGNTRNPYDKTKGKIHSNVIIFKATMATPFNPGAKYQVTPHFRFRKVENKIFFYYVEYLFHLGGGYLYNTGYNKKIYFYSIKRNKMTGVCIYHTEKISTHSFFI